MSRTGYLTMDNGISRDQLLGRRATDYLRDGLCDAQGALRAELAGLDAFAVAVQLEEAAASPDELTATFEALRKVLRQCEGAPGPAPDRYKAAVREALEVTSRVLGIPNNIKIRGWLNNECGPFIRTEADIRAFAEFFRAVARQYLALRAVKSMPERDDH